MNIPDEDLQWLIVYFERCIKYLEDMTDAYLPPNSAKYTSREMDRWKAMISKVRAQLPPSSVDPTIFL